MFLDFESRQRPNGGRAVAKAILDQVLLSDELAHEDVPFVLPCFYWTRRHLTPPHIRLPPSLRTQCNKRQRKIFATFRQLSSVEDDAMLARGLTGRDTYDNSLRLCAFLELFIEYNGPFEVLKLMQRIGNGRQRMQYGEWKVDSLCKASRDSITHLVATTVHSLGQRLAKASCRALQMNDATRALSVILSLSGEMEVAKVFYGVTPKLKGGELPLCYSLLLATGMASDDDTREMWGLLSGAVGGASSPIDIRTTMTIIAIVSVTYTCGEGSKVLFPWLYAELVKRNLQVHAERAWESFGGVPSVWTGLVIEVRTNCELQRRKLEQIFGAISDEESDSDDAL